MNATQAISKACNCINGTQKDLADLLDVSAQAISKWRNNRIPAERALQIENVTGGCITRYELRPDLYPKEDAA